MTDFATPWRFAAVLLAAIVRGRPHRCQPGRRPRARDERRRRPRKPAAGRSSRSSPGSSSRASPSAHLTAPVTLVEYADLQCPYCAQWSRETLPVLVDEFVEDRQAEDRLPRTGLHRPRLRQGPAHGDRRRPGQPPLGRRPRPLREPGRRERRLGHRRARHRDRRRRSRPRRREAPLRPLGERRRARAEARSRCSPCRRRAWHSCLPARADRRPARSSSRSPRWVLRGSSLRSRRRSRDERARASTRQRRACGPRRGDHRLPALRPPDRRSSRLLDRRLRDGSELNLRRGAGNAGRRRSAWSGSSGSCWRPWRAASGPA